MTPLYHWECCEELAFDTETSGGDLIGFSLSDGQTHEYYAVHHESNNDLDEDSARIWLHAILGNPGRVVWAHNWKYDLRVVIDYLGEPPTAKMGDTMIAAWLTCNGVPFKDREGNTRHRFGLKQLVPYHGLGKMVTYENTVLVGEELPRRAAFIAERLGHDLKAEKAKLQRKGVHKELLQEYVLHWGGRYISPDQMRRYARDDAKHTYALAQKAKVWLRDHELWDWFWSVEMGIVQMLQEMEDVGIAVNRDMLRERVASLSQETEQLERAWFDATGFSVRSTNGIRGLFAGKVWPVLRKTSKDHPSFNRDTLENILKRKDLSDRGRHLAELKLRHQKLSKALSTYLIPLLEYSEKDGRVHTQFVQHGTETGRFSSHSPNLQNQSKPGNDPARIREAFVASPGFKLGGCDMDQFEIVIMAHYSKDPLILECLHTEQSLHDIRAREFNLPRPLAKQWGLAMQYGSAPTTLSTAAGLPLTKVAKRNGLGYKYLAHEKAQKFYDEFYKVHSGIGRYMKAAADFARKHGYIRTLAKRRRYIPEIYGKGEISPEEIEGALARFDVINRSGAEYVLRKLEKGRGERIAANAPIQGSASDIMKRAMVNLRQLWIEKGWWMRTARVLLQIHDELIFEAKEDIIEEAAKDVARCMSEAWPELTVPLRAKPKIGDNWEQVK